MYSPLVVVWRFLEVPCCRCCCCCCCCFFFWGGGHLPWHVSGTIWCDLKKTPPPPPTHFGQSSSPHCPHACPQYWDWLWAFPVLWLPSAWWTSCLERVCLWWKCLYFHRKCNWSSCLQMAWAYCAFARIFPVLHGLAVQEHQHRLWWQLFADHQRPAHSYACYHTCGFHYCSLHVHHFYIGVPHYRGKLAPNFFVNLWYHKGRAILRPAVCLCMILPHGFAH